MLSKRHLLGSGPRRVNLSPARHLAASSRSLVKPATRSSFNVVTRAGGDDGGKIGGSSGGGGGDGGKGDGKSDGGGSEGGDPRLPQALATILLAAGRTVESFPADFASALLSGKVTVEILKRFLEFEANFFAKLVWGIQGFRERLLADPSFPIKLAIECGIGVVTKVTAEKTKREDKFWAEIDFVGANVVMAIIADFMLTWLPAPTLSYAPQAAKSSNALLSFFAGCPDNAFQKVQPGMPGFTVSQRFGAILRNGTKLLGVGFCASMIGVGMTNVLAALRQAFDPSWSMPNKAQDVLATSAAYGVYMSVSSNLRYQIVAGIIEERGIETIFKGQHQLCHALSFIIRTGNTFVGSLLWVDFVRLCGMQKSEKAPPPPPPPVVASAPAKGKKGGKSNK